MAGFVDSDPSTMGHSKDRTRMRQFKSSPGAQVRRRCSVKKKIDAVLWHGGGAVGKKESDSGNKDSDSTRGSVALKRVHGNIDSKPYCLRSVVWSQLIEKGRLLSS